MILKIEYLFIAIFVALFLYITYNQIRVLYYRNFKSFNKEIEEFLKSNNYEFVENRKPTQEDWKKSPFEQPSDLEISFVIIRVNGLPVTWTDLKYKIIFGEHNNQITKIWMEIKTTYFQKPQLKFIVI